MEEHVLDILARYESAINKKRLLFKLQLTSVCVKSDPMSLLPVKVQLNGELVNIEQAADVVKRDDQSLILIPHEGCPLENISEGVLNVHPEFKQSYIGAKVSPDSDETVTLLKFEMPEVNKDRHDVLVQAVDTLADTITTAIDADKAFYSTKIAMYMVGATPSDADEVNKRLDEGADTCKGMVGEDADNKKKDIEEAYARYLENGGSDKSLGDIKETVAASEEDVVNSMKMG